jgi:hypothetical protein
MLIELHGSNRLLCLPLLGLLGLAGCSQLGTAVDDASDSPADLESSTDAGLRSPVMIDQASSPMCQPCAKYGAPQNRGMLPAMLTETSGLAASRAHPGVLYAHNDSGGGAVFYAVAETGALIATIRLPGVTLEDTEDIDVGPCPAGACIYLGDIGDNGQSRILKKVVRVAEPDLSPGGMPRTLDATQIEELPFSYPAGTRHNAETLLVHPQTGDIYVATKEDAGERSALFKFPQPLQPGKNAVLVRVAQLPIPKSTDQDLSGGDIHPCGIGVLLRTGNRLYLLPVQNGMPFESLFSPPSSDPPYVLDVPAATEANAESVAWNAAGTGYFTVSEGLNQTLHGVSCAAN